jgi:hypothetical protein
VYVNEEEVFRNKKASVTNIVRRCVMEKDASSYGLSAVMLLNSALVSDLAQLLLPRNWDMSKKPSILPVEITFRVRCQSSLSATNSGETTASTSVYPFFAVSFLVKQQDSSGVRRIDEPLKMTATVQAPNAVDLALLPRFNLTWSRQLKNNDGENVGEEIDCRQFQRTNPGSLSFPPMTLRPGSWEFTLLCSYKAPGSSDMLSISLAFHTESISTTPVAVITAPLRVGTSCPFEMSSLRSYDAGLLDATGKPETSLPAQYSYEWKCGVLGTSPQHMTAADDSLVVKSRLQQATPCFANRKGMGDGLTDEQQTDGAAGKWICPRTASLLTRFC